MMRAIMAAVGRALRAILGILWMPFEVVGSIFSGFGGSGSADPQEQAASVARNAAREERATSRGAVPKLPGIDDPMLVKEIAVRMAAGKPLPEGAKVSRAVLEALSAMPKGVLKQFTAAHLHTVQAFIEGLKKDVTAPRAERAAPELRSRVAARVAARPGADGNAGPGWGWAAS